MVKFDTTGCWGFDDPAHAALFTATEALLERWRQRVETSDSLGTLPAETIAELFDTGLLRSTMPARVGGLELDWPALVESARIAAWACPSTAWIISLVGGHIQIASRFPEECVNAIFRNGSRQLVATGSVTADGTILTEGRGYRVDGRWRLSSGIDHATWVIVSAPCRIPASNPEPATVMALVPTSDIEVSGVWQAAGMVGTGSKDVNINRRYMSDTWVRPLSELLGRQSGVSRHYLQSVSLVPYLTSAIIGPLLGCAEGAIIAGIEIMQQRQGPHRGEAPREVSLRIGEIIADLECARLLYRSILSRLHDAGSENRDLSDSEYAAIKRDRAKLTRLCIDAVQQLIRQMGTSAIVWPQATQRLWRDLQVMAAHMDVNWDRSMMHYGSSVLSPSATE
ncbi:acyl-CoA dehydrogenase family protein [Agrobacterium vitis]|uniref:acyl-CoA dehydrogenase family protein n=1 Tax=Agrobacterium vitis TaxID=373 RepID=UPI0009C141B6